MYFMISSANHGDGFDTLHFHIFVVLKECNKNTCYLLIMCSSLSMMPSK